MFDMSLERNFKFKKYRIAPELLAFVTWKTFFFFLRNKSSRIYLRNSQLETNKID